MQSNALPAFFSHLTESLTDTPTEVRRVFHGRGRCWEGLEQLTADWLQGQLLVGLFKEPTEEFLQELVNGLQEFSKSDTWKKANGQSILVQHRSREGAPTEVICGELNDFPVVSENNLRYQLELGKNQNMGIFLDMRYGRKWVQSQSENKKVLNLFAYTCGFSVAAIAGGAQKVVNLDMAKAALSRGRDNHRLNDHDLSKVSFLGHDLFKSWGKVRKLGPYDLIVIDPPSFQKGSFALTKDYQKILRRLPELLTEQGTVLACVNDPAISPDFLIEGMKAEAPQLQFTERLENPPEFADIANESGLKALVFQLIAE